MNKKDYFNEFETIYNNLPNTDAINIGYLSDEIIRRNIAPNQLTAAMVKDIMDQYTHDVYRVSYINKIMAELDGKPRTFSVTKKIYIDTDICEYIMCVNNVLGIKVLPDDPYSIVYLYLEEDKELYMDRLAEEAYEKISSKYMQYISRIEDSLGKPFSEILELGLTQ